MLLQCSLLTLDGDKVLSCNYCIFQLHSNWPDTNTFNKQNSKKLRKPLLNYYLVNTILNYYF